MDSQYYFNPYSGQTFFGFFFQLILRFWALITGQISLENLSSDEVQLLVLAGVAASSALVGTFLVLRKMTMLANSLSHTILVGIVIAFLWTYGVGSNVPPHTEQIGIHILLIASLFMGLVTAFLTELLTKGARLQEDASTGIVFTSLFAVGVIAVTLLTRNAHIGTEAVMGNVDALQLGDAKLVYVVLAINIFIFVLFFKEFNITTFDPGLSKSFGIAPAFFSYLLMTQVSSTSIGAFRAVGVLMVLAFITGPALTARLLTSTLKKMLLVSVGIGVFASFVGVALSRHILTVYGISLSTAGVVVCVIVIFYLLAAVYANKHILLRKF
ncbi:MAG TPA: metal ABC transporter permease, partial [Parachlamydiaceae bacterium]|nr:metal ABC transporter permease [Parachlamydiaceae bacterium]